MGALAPRLQRWTSCNIQNGRHWVPNTQRGLESGLGYWALQSIFANPDTCWKLRMTARGFQKVRKWPPGSCPLWINFHYNWWWQRIKRKNLNFLIPCPDIVHGLSILFSLLVFVLFITWSQFCMQFSWLFHDVLMTCTHGLFLTYTCLDHGLIMTCSWISTLIIYINWKKNSRGDTVPLMVDNYHVFILGGLFGSGGQDVWWLGWGVAWQNNLE